MSLTVGDVFKIPGAINDELKRRSDLRAEAVAAHLLNKISGNRISPNPLHFNPYYHDGEQGGQSDVSHAEANADRSWGNNGLWGHKGW